MESLWTLAENPGLDERGSPLLTSAPIEYENTCALTEGVIGMRQGFATVSLTGSGLTGPVLWMGEFLTNAGVRELWAAANNTGTAAMARRVGSTWSTVAFSDTAAAADLLYMHGLSMNGKFFLAYNSDVNRLHVWDGTAVRRVGLPLATAVTAATMGGAGLTFNRWYRKRLVVTSGGVVTRRSEPSAVPVNVSIVNDAGVTVTQGTVAGEGETDWEVEASTDVSGAPSIWYRIATVVIGTTTYDDTNAAIDTFEISDEVGLFVPPPSAKYLSTDGLSITMGAAWETSASAGETVPKQNRAWFTPPLGSLDVGDDERIPDTATQHNWIDVGDAGPITALGSPIYNDTIVLKDRSVNKLTPTGILEAPYSLSVISAAMGCVDQRVVSTGELAGVPALLFADRNAVYALTVGGVVNLTEPVGRSFRTTTIAAETGLLLFDSFQRIAVIQTSLAPGSQAGTYTSYMLDVVKKRWSGLVLGDVADQGWVLGTSLLGTNTFLGGANVEVFNGVLASTTDGERRLYLCGQDINAAASVLVWGEQCGMDGTYSPFSDRGRYTATARFRKMVKPGYQATFGAPTVWYRNPQGTTTTAMQLLVRYTRDFDQVTQDTITMDATDANNGIQVVQHTFEALAAADVSVLDVTVTISKSTGMPFLSEVTPTVDAITIPYTVGSPLAQ